MSGVEKTYNVGVMGCANIATRSLLPAFQKHGRFNVYAVASRSTDKAERVASDYHCKAYGNYDDLVSDKDIDLIYMPLPTGLHYEWGKKVLQSGKHLLSEKSLACLFSEVKDLVGIAKNNHLLLMESFQFRFHTQTQWVRDVVNSGKLGEIRCFRSSFGFPPFKDADNIRYQKELGGGALLDAGAYTIKSMKVILPNEEFAFKSASMITPAGSEVDLYGGAFFESEGEDAGRSVLVERGISGDNIALNEKRSIDVIPHVLGTDTDFDISACQVIGPAALQEEGVPPCAQSLVNRFTFDGFSGENILSELKDNNIEFYDTKDNGSFEIVFDKEGIREISSD